MTKFAGLQVALRSAILAVVSAAAAHAETTRIAAVSKQAVEAKMEYCQDCHGLSGQGHRGFFPIPRLAGLQPEYIKNQLQAFVERRRVNPIMFNVALDLSPSMQTTLAANFSRLNPTAIGGAPKELVATGRKIYEDGVPDANVAACTSCHGPDAKGNGEAPRLAGQLYPYIVKVLASWSKERGQNLAKPDTSAIMEPIARSLTKPQMDAVAAYLSYLK